MKNKIFMLPIIAAAISTIVISIFPPRYSPGQTNSSHPDSLSNRLDRIEFKAAAVQGKVDSNAIKTKMLLSLLERPEPVVKTKVITKYVKVFVKAKDSNPETEKEQLKEDTKQVTTIIYQACDYIYGGGEIKYDNYNEWLKKNPKGKSKDYNKYINNLFNKNK